MRVGVGYDVHRLVLGRRLVLGGVVVPYSKGLDGHSDADVLVHAVMDALLGAASLGDVGSVFPDSDAKFKDASSLSMLRDVRELLRDKNHRIENIDSVVVAQAPKISGFVRDMVLNISDALCVEEGCVSVKATTTEGLGFEGCGEGVAAWAVCLLG